MGNIVVNAKNSIVVITKAAETNQHGPDKQVEKRSATRREILKLLYLGLPGWILVRKEFHKNAPEPGKLEARFTAGEPTFTVRPDPAAVEPRVDFRATGFGRSTPRVDKAKTRWV